jgi:PAS domain S-box-containing protein
MADINQGRNTSIAEGPGNSLTLAAAGAARLQTPRDDEIALLHKIFDAALDELTIVRLSDGVVVYVNDEFLKRGYTREEVLGKTVVELGLWSSKQDHRRLLVELRAQGFLRNQEVEAKMRDGRVVPCLLSSTIVDLNGEQCVLSVAREITELKSVQDNLGATVAKLTETERQLKAEIERRDQLEARMRASEEKLRKIIEASPESISINSMVDGRYIETNAQFRTTGYSNEEVAAKPAGELGVWARHDQFRDYVRRLRAKSLVRNLEADFRTKDGGIRPCLISGAVIDLDGEPCVVSFTSDISRLKRAEQEIIDSREAALAASHAKSQFLSSMSHEIRTPMNAILGMADLLGESDLTLEQRRYVETMISNGNSLLGLINDILDLAKVESGKLQLEESDFDLTELVECAAETLAVRAAEKGLELATHVLPDVPCRLVGDPLRLRQIFINLLGNAIKFTERGEIVLRVERAENAPPGGGDDRSPVPLRFSVRDTGVGIAADKLGTIFESFSQADSSTTRKYGGSGLGLAIVVRLAELMGGAIEVESEPGRGSTFRFTASFGMPDSPQTEVEPRADLANLRMLIVDDNATNRLILREMLAVRDVVVGEASGGEAALAEVERARVEGFPYQLVLLDCRMPVMDGFQVAERLMQRYGPAHPIVLMLTSDDASPNPSRARAVGINSYVVKPVKRLELFKVIASALGNVKAAETQSASHSAAAISQPAENRRLRILLAEDSPDNRLLIEAYLKKLPYQLDTAENGQVAVEKFMRQHYDLVLMDVRMPVMDGYTAVRRIRDWERERGRPSTPIVALTASALEDDIRNSLEAGCTTHVGKPVRKSRLLETIRELTDLSTPDRTHARAHA